ncbi:MAG: PAS domain S-box protein [Dehalococcoidales bacterium]|nr:PAS domain S-box protein [Dehalococcoidales bacterium]
MAHRTLTGSMTSILRKPGFWLILAVMVLITVPHYSSSLQHPGFISQLMADLNITRHTFERILYLAPIIWAGFLFGWWGAFITSLAAIACMVPHVVIYSTPPWQSAFEIGAVVIIGCVISVGFVSLRRERDYHKRLEVIQQELKTSEERYRSLFENAIDAIWMHDLEGNFITANKASEKMIGCSREELYRKNVKEFLSQESLDLAHRIRNRLLNDEAVEQPYEQRFSRRDGSVVYMQLATSIVWDKGKPAGFQHIARDITEQKMMNDNLRFYLKQATRAQEEERKRISHELHDDTIQALVVLSRQLDALSTSTDGVSDDMKRHLEELWQQTDSILQGIRRLSQDLRPAAIDRLGLLPAVQWLASEVTKHSNIATKVNIVGEEHRLPEEVAIALFRIIQEALRNIWRHSGATKAEITFEFTANKTKITINDNGKGFVLAGKVGELAKQGKLGLVGMQERVQLIGGTISVESEPDKGTTIIVEAPG